MKELNKALHRTAHKAPPVTADVGHKKMNTSIKTVLISALMALAMSYNSSAVSHLSLPLERENDQLCITFPDRGTRWMITITLDKVYPSTYGQRLCITKDNVITLADKHIIHTIKAVIQEDRVGLEVTTQEDLRSFGGGITQESYFIPVPKENENQGQQGGPAYPPQGVGSADP